MANGGRLDRFGRYAGILSVPVLAVGLYLGLVVAPPDAMMGDVQRIMYVHFPSWIAVGLAYTTGFVGSVLYLVRRQERFDYWAQAGIEVGLVFNITGLISGSLWGRPPRGGSFLALGSPPHQYRDHGDHVCRVSGPPRFHRRPRDPRAGGRPGGDGGLSQRPDRLFLGEMVANPAPGPIEPADGGLRHGEAPPGDDR